MFCKCFLPVYGLLFPFCNRIFWRVVFHFGDVQFLDDFLMKLVNFVSYLRHLPNRKSLKIFLLWSLLAILQLWLLHLDLDSFSVNFFTVGSGGLFSFALGVGISVFFRQPVVRRLSFPHWVAFTPLWQTNWPYMHRLFLDSLFCPIDLYIYLYANTTLSWLL